MPGRWGYTNPTNVTAVAKSQTNRARSVAAGVVSGAGVGPPVLQRPHSDESAPSRTSARAGRNLGKAVQGAGACLRVVPGTIAHTKGVTGIIGSNEVGGGWKQFHPPAPVSGSARRGKVRSRGRVHFFRAAKPVVSSKARSH